MRYLHFADDTNLSIDRYCKIRPLVENLNVAFKQADISENSSIDETMIPYNYDTLGRDQELPVRFGKAAKMGLLLQCAIASAE